MFKTIRRWPTHGSSIASAGVGRAGLCTAGQAEPHKAKAALFAWQGIHWNTQRKAEKWTSFWQAIRSDWHIRLARKRSPVTLQPETHIPCWSSGKIKHVALPRVTKGVAKSIFISGGKKIRLIKQSSFCFWVFVFFPLSSQFCPAPGVTELKAQTHCNGKCLVCHTLYTGVSNSCQSVTFIC